jgi:dynamin-like GTPase MGM1, mitochondrial
VPPSELRKQTTGVITDIQDSAADFYDAATQTISPYLSTAGNTLSSFRNSAQSTVEGAYGAFSETAEGLDLDAQGWFAAVGDKLKSLGGGGGGGGERGKGREEEKDGGGPGGSAGGGGGPEPAAVVTGAAAAAATALRTKSRAEESEESEEEEANQSDVDGDTSPPTDLLGLTRKLISIRNILRSIDQSDALTLPSIVVIGSQSSGKSSVLEAIVGQEFLPKYVSSPNIPN